MKRFPQSFFLRPTLDVARDLLGARLTTTIRGVKTSGRIVEVEAYYGPTDPASHSHRGETPRNAPMFRPGGLCYVYLIYGLHHCVNVVTEKEGIGAAVLIRALEPVEGIAAMERRRQTKDSTLLTSGPARLCEALKITRALSGHDLLRSGLIKLTPDEDIPDHAVKRSTRIGISKGKELDWRFFIRGNDWVSKAR